MKRLPWVMSVLLATVCSAIITFAQQDGRPPFGDKHVGGDVPIDERRDETTGGGRRPLTPPPEDRVIENGILAPSKDDRAAFAAFLRMRNTGLIRLLPRESVTYQIKKGAPRIPGGGAHYSFAHVTHSLSYGSDLKLISDQLYVGYADLGYGFLTNLGDVPLEEVALTDPRTTFIAAYRPAVTFLEARAETLRFRAGITVEGIRYQDGLPVEENATYLLRSINYGKSVFVSRASAGAVRSASNTDVLIAFKVVRKDSDGGVIIAWKLLKKYSAPKIE
jgi:hypothetical protein